MDESVAARDDFDRVMAPAQQARWLVEPHWRDRDGMRPGDADWRERDAPRFERLRAMKVWPEVEDVLRRYLHAGVPAARRSEWAYWSCACMPDSEEVMTLAEVHVGARRVCAAVIEDDLAFTFHFALSLADVERFTQRPNVDVTELRPLSGKDVEVTVRAVGRDAAVSVLDDEVVVRALRRNNLELVRAGRCVASDRHNIVLADALLLEPGLVLVPPPDGDAYKDPVPRKAPYRGPTKLDPALSVDDAFAFIDGLIVARQYEAAADALRDLRDRHDDLPDNSMVTRLETIAPMLIESGRLRYALTSIVTYHSDLGDDARVFEWLPRTKAAFEGSDSFDEMAVITAVTGRSHRRTGHPARGIELLSRGLASFTDVGRKQVGTMAAFTMELARCYTALGDFGAAREHLSAALRSLKEGHPLRAALWCAIAERHQRARDLPSARSSLEEALALVSTLNDDVARPPLLAALGWFDERLDFNYVAVEHYTEALAGLGDGAKVGLRRGVLAGLVRCLDKLRKSEEADGYLARAEALEGLAWPEEGEWPLDDLIELLLQAAWLDEEEPAA